MCIQVPKDGDCLHSSVKSSLQIEENSSMDKMYAARYVKHQAIAHFLEYRELLLDDVIEAIRIEYGRVDLEIWTIHCKGVPALHQQTQRVW